MAYPLPGMCKTLAVRPRQVGWDAYAGGWINYPGGVSGAVFRSTDFGATWESLATSPLDTVTGVWVTSDADFDILCATTSGVYRSADTGRSWTRILAAGKLRAIAGFSDTCVVAGDSGVWFSNDRGSTWVKFDTGMAVTRVNCLRFVGGASPPSLWLLAGTQGGAVYGWNFGPPAIVEQDRTERLDQKAATICRTRLLVKMGSAGSACLLDISGRRVLDLVPGPNSVSQLALGVYFLRVSDGDHKTETKLVLIR